MVEVREDPVVEKIKARSTKRAKKSQPKAKSVSVGGLTMQTSVARRSKQMLEADVGAQDVNTLLEKEIVRLTKSMKRCHTKALNLDPSVRGKWKFSFIITPAGKASGLNVTALRRKNASIEECIKLKINNKTFTNKPDQNYKVTRTVIF